MGTGREEKTAKLYESFLNNGYWIKETQIDRLEMCAEKYGDKIAVTDDERALTYKELTNRSHAYAAFFLSKGMKNGDIVLLQHINAVSFAEIIFAFYKIGVIVLPMLPSYREIEVEGIINLVNPKMYIAIDKYMGFDYRSFVYKIAENTKANMQIMFISELEAIDFSNYSLSKYDFEKVRYDTPSIIVTSGGSTGTPKLIERCHANYVNSQITCAKSINMTDDYIDLISMPLAHNWNLCGPGMIGAILNGSMVVLSKYNFPDEIIRLIEKYRVTVMAVVPALLQACIEYREYDMSEDISSLRVIQIGGSVCPSYLVKKAMSVFDCKVQQIYGMGEGFVSATALDDDFDVITNTQGYPVAEGSEIRIVDENGNDVRDGSSGELIVRGPSVVTEYYKSPEFTKESFTDDLFYRTGDEAVLVKNGRIKILGRVIDLINRAGEKITPAEVEDNLLKIDSIIEAAVVGGKDKALGERICAFVTSKDKNLSLESVREDLIKQGLAMYKLPDMLEILQEMPYTAINKIDKKLLKKRVN